VEFARSSGLVIAEVFDGGVMVRRAGEICRGLLVAVGLDGGDAEGWIRAPILA